MKTILIAAILFGTTSAFAGERRDHIKLCNNLTAINSVSELELKSFQARDYKSISSTYMKVVLNQFLSNLSQVESLTNGKDARVLLLKQDVLQELGETRIYDSYRLSTAATIFKNIAVDTKSLLKSYSCL